MFKSIILLAWSKYANWLKTFSKFTRNQMDLVFEPSLPLILIMYMSASLKYDAYMTTVAACQLPISGPINLIQIFEFFEFFSSLYIR